MQSRRPVLDPDVEREIIEKWLRNQENPEQYLAKETLSRLREREDAER